MSALELLRTTLEKNAGKVAWVDTALDALNNAKPQGTMRAWFEMHNGQSVETLQIQTDPWPTRAWAPGSRVIDASRAGSVRLDGSAREYKGLRVVAATYSVLIVESSRGEAIAYVVVS